MTIIRLLMSNRWAQGLGFCVAILLLAFALGRCARYAMSSATEAGRQEQQASDLRETIKQVEKANAAAEAIRRNADARYVECLRHARNPSDC